MPINPLVDRPQTKNEPTKYQKFLTLLASFNAFIAAFAALPFGNTGGCQSSAAPYGVVLILCGSSFKKK